jgi:hypothetical protein
VHQLGGLGHVVLTPQSVIGNGEHVSIAVGNSNASPGSTSAR